MAPASGDHVGPYQVVALLGAGGMGMVYRARDTRLGRDVAIKVISDGMAHEPERLKRFADEARAAGAIEHPAILGVHDVGMHEGTPADAAGVSQILPLMVNATGDGRAVADTYTRRTSVLYLVEGLR